jgi:hypothetical protein
MKKPIRTTLIILASLGILLAGAAFKLRGTGIPTAMRMRAYKMLSAPQPGPASVTPDRINICPATRELEKFSESRHLSACDDKNEQFKSLYSGEKYRWVPNDGIYYNDYLVRIQGKEYVLNNWHATGKLVLFLNGGFLKTNLNVNGIDEVIADGEYYAPDYGVFDTGVAILQADQPLPFYVHDYNKDLKLDRVAVGWVDPFDLLGRLKCGILGQPNVHDIEDFEGWAILKAQEMGGEIQRRTCWTDSNEGGYDFDFNDFVMYFVVVSQ